MWKARLFDFSLFFLALTVTFYTGKLYIDTATFLGALMIYWFFSSLYFPLKYSNKNGNVTIDYTISYSLSFVIFAGPLGLFIFECLLRPTVYLYKKWTNTADSGEFLDIFYNIGMSVLSSSVCFYIYHLLHNQFALIPGGIWILMMVLTIINILISSICLNTVFFILGDLHSFSQAIQLVKNRNFLDIAKISFTNGFLLIFLLEKNWDMLISMFILTYIVNRSFYSRAQSIQDKIERDRFEQMAYTDFLTGVANRAAMDHQMTKLNTSKEAIAIVVSDIDMFKLINDTYNHAIGDRVIQHFAQSLNRYLSNDDKLFRSGGEEFTFILRNRSYEACVSLVEEMMTHIRTSTVNIEYKGAPEKISYTASFGLFYYQITSGLPLEKGYIQADQLLYESKYSGRNRLTSIHYKKKPVPLS